MTLKPTSRGIAVVVDFDFFLGFFLFGVGGINELQGCLRPAPRTPRNFRWSGWRRGSSPGAGKVRLASVVLEGGLGNDPLVVGELAVDQLGNEDHGAEANAPGWRQGDSKGFVVVGQLAASSTTVLRAGSFPDAANRRSRRWR